MFFTPEEARAILGDLLATGAEFAEIYAESTSPTTLIWDDGHLDEASSGTERGVGLRLSAGVTVYYANGNGTGLDETRALARTLAASLAGGASPVKEPAPFTPREAPARSHVRIAPETIPLADRVAVLRRADTAARGCDARVSQVTATWRDSVRRVQIANSDGVNETDEATYLTLAVLVVAKEGAEIRSAYEVASETSGYEMFSGDRAHRPEEIAREAVRVALLQLAAAPAPSGTFPVVVGSSAGGTMIHEACGHGFEADFIEKGLSVYAGRIGEQVASPLVTAVDDGTLAQKRGTNRVDDEGTPTSRVVLIENGILKGYLHSLRTARQMGARATGNGRRESFRHLPIPRMRNTMILPGTTPPEEMVASVADGIFIADMGGGEVDIVSGNFMFHCPEAYRIRDGKIAEPLRDVTLTGRGPEILASIDRVGTDHGFNVGTCGKDGQAAPVADAQPTLRIPAIVVGGTGAEDVGGRDAAGAAERDR
jgi:TldD protein